MSRRKQKQDPVLRQAKFIGVPSAQIRSGAFVLVDIANRTEQDQRHMVRSGEKRTIRRKTKIEKLRDAGVISTKEALACEWYQSAYEEYFETRVRIADWSGTCGSSDKAFGHWPVGMTLEPGDTLVEYARKSISPMFLPLFERVVLHGRPLGKLAITFRMAARQLLEAVEGRVAF